MPKTFFQNTKFPVEPSVVKTVCWFSVVYKATSLLKAKCWLSKRQEPSFFEKTKAETFA